MAKLFKTFLFMFLFSGIVFAEEFEIKTTPDEAEVFISAGPGKKETKLGNTPLKMPSEDVFNQTGQNKSILVTIKKEGFDPFRVMMIKTPGVDYKMEILLNISKEITTIKKHDLLMAELFKAQRMIRASNFGDALNKLTELEKDYKEFSIITEMKGIAYYMQKDLNNALSMFRIAFSKNTKNRDAYKMKVYLEKKLGLDAEAK